MQGAIVGEILGVDQPAPYSEHDQVASKELAVSSASYELPDVAGWTVAVDQHLPMGLVKAVVPTLLSSTFSPRLGNTT